MVSITIKDDKTIDVTIKTKDSNELLKALNILNNASSAINVNDGRAESKVHILYLRDCGSSKLQCVKAVKENLFLGLKEAKDICDSTSDDSVEIASSLDINYLSRLKEQIEGSGATCYID